jgi:SAM-dependent methyltransferase
MDGDHVHKNRETWNAISDRYQEKHGRQLEQFPLAWGTWSIPERTLKLLGNVACKDVLELGCGAAQWTIALSALGARVVGLDFSDRQLAHARVALTQAKSSARLVLGNAEILPFVRRSFDVVFCDHGAMTWCVPERVVAEVARVLRPGGRFVFSAPGPFQYVCLNPTGQAEERLLHSYFNLTQVLHGSAVAFTRPYGEWIRIFRRNAFAIEDLIEVRPEPDAETSFWTRRVPLEWARRWPAEMIWRLRREDDGDHLS